MIMDMLQTNYKIEYNTCEMTFDDRNETCVP